MNEKYTHLKVLFSQVQPELLRQQILAGHFGHSKTAKYLGTQDVSEAAYLHLAHNVPELSSRSQDDLKQSYYSLQEFLSERQNGGILRLIEQYANDVLRFQQGEPMCRQESLFSWRDNALDLGQDLFTCAGLAALDVRERCVTEDFLWAPVIRTDRVELQSILDRGLAENHYHMNGSSQIFPISWAFLMNHPQSIRAYFEKAEFGEDLNGTYSFGVQNNRISWRERIYEAAWIRQQLFSCICGNEKPTETVQNYAKFVRGKRLYGRLITAVHTSRVYALQGFSPNETWRKLDYTLEPFKLAEFVASSRRLLAGERFLLYHCFRNCYDGTFSTALCDLFYLYLLYKIRFRKELVQTNHRLGFRNFAEYQDRKANIWGDDSLYWTESCRLSAANALARPYHISKDDESYLPSRPMPHMEEKDRCVTSLEMRIMPSMTPEDLIQSVWSADQYILHGMNVSFSGIPNKESYSAYQKQILQYLKEYAPFFYVLHFAKQPQERISESAAHSKRPCLRSKALREKVRLQAVATAKALSRSSYLCSRIRGIDACNHEIGCRPEIFATAFRYLRNLTPINDAGTRTKRYFPLLTATYHVGEDFLDLTDGLRAIDEAICFLNLQSGERLGHALALGTLPEVYYKNRRWTVKMPVQDLLDNIVWLLFRTLEWDVPVPSSLRSKLELQAISLIALIYGEYHAQKGTSTEPFTLSEYFEAWKLRGDDPELYRLFKADVKRYDRNMEKLAGDESQLCTPYHRAMLNRMNWNKDSRFETAATKEEFLLTRKNRKTATLTYLYFFDPMVRWEGQKVRDFQISEGYVKVIHDLQNYMMRKIAYRGLSIECNPSSNRLIGSFGNYQSHPMFRFNHIQLPLTNFDDQPSQLHVSINTDDLGVFDTSLENEYALIYSALQEYQDSNGSLQIGNTTICDYLESVRRMGCEMTFPKAERTERKRSGQE